mmetsp:Transcript_7334/g.17651  ORF Transcript_7334/g.17651 Transcript_7334/m.17651 type:complete len:249 (+) Transcript_7334:590-1336(+)
MSCSVRPARAACCTIAVPRKSVISASSPKPRVARSIAPSALASSAAMVASVEGEKGTCAWGQWSQQTCTSSRCWIEGRMYPWSIGMRVRADHTPFFEATRRLSELRSMLKMRASKMPIACTWSTPNPAVPMSSAVHSCGQKRCSDPTLICTSAWSGSSVVCEIRSIVVAGTAARPSWSRRNAAHSRTAPPPTGMPRFICDSSSARPTKPLGLDGPNGSSSIGLNTAATSPRELYIMYVPPQHPVTRSP